MLTPVSHRDCHKDAYNLSHPNLTLEFYTAPPDAPPSVDDAATSDLSTSVTLPALVPYLERIGEARISAYLVACFSPHPLTPLLRERTTSPVLNIFEASVLHARALDLSFGIVTTGAYWEAVLTDGVREILAGKVDVASGDVKPSDTGIRGFKGVRSTGLTAAQLHSTPKDEVKRRIAEATSDLVGSGADAIILGCAGMSGMEEAVREGARAVGRMVRIIDGVRAGVVLLEGLAKAYAV